MKESMIVKLAGLFYILNGGSMLFIWPMLIITGGVPELKTQFTYVVFHLVSEFITAVLGIVTGVGLLLNRELSKCLYFLSSGFFLIAGYLACSYYLFSPETRSVGMASMLFGINLVIILLLVLNSKLLYPGSAAFKASLIFDGAMAYVLINVVGMLFDKGTGYTIAYGGAALLLLGYTLCKSWYLIKSTFREKTLSIE
jgi:hypothetical protein